MKLQSLFFNVHHKQPQIWNIQSVRTSEAWQEVLELSDATKSWMINFYSEYYKSDFFDKMLAIYLSGHLPCGWSGEYPEGRFFVY